MIKQVNMKLKKLTKPLYNFIFKKGWKKKRRKRKSKNKNITSVNTNNGNTKHLYSSKVWLFFSPLIKTILTLLILAFPIIFFYHWTGKIGDIITSSISFIIWIITSSMTILCWIKNDDESHPNDMTIKATQRSEKKKFSLYTTSNIRDLLIGLIILVALELIRTIPYIKIVYLILLLPICISGLILYKMEDPFNEINKNRERNPMYCEEQEDGRALAVGVFFSGCIAIIAVLIITIIWGFIILSNLNIFFG